MTFRILILLGLIPLFSQVNFAQAPAVYSEFQMFEQFINPAICGRGVNKKIILANRKYWLQTDDSPNDVSFGADGRIGYFNFYNPKMLLNKTGITSTSRMGLGIYTNYSTNGPANSLFTNISYAYHIPFDQASSTQLSFGLSGLLYHYELDWNKLKWIDSGDPELEEERYYLVPDAGFGIYYNTPQFYIGASANEIFKSNRPLEDKEFENKTDFSFQTGYNFFFNYFDFEPSVFVSKINMEPLFYYAQLKCYYQNYNWIFVGYKSTQTLSTGIGMRVNRAHLAYIYDINLGKISKYYNSSHEIVLGFNVGLFEPEGIRKVVRNKKRF